jgi:hypothetical protein
LRASKISRARAASSGASASTSLQLGMVPRRYPTVPGGS